MDEERNALKAMCNLHVEAMEDLIESLRLYTNANDREGGLILALQIKRHAERYLERAATGFVASKVEFGEETA